MKKVTGIHTIPVQGFYFSVGNYTFGGFMKQDLMQIRSQIVERLEEYIEEKKYKAHDQLPSEREFCELWNCNRMTLRAAIKRLINEGVLYNLHGKGTFLAEKKIERNLWQFSSFSKALEASGHEVKTEMLEVRKIEATKKISELLRLPLGKEIIEIKRLRIVDKEPMAIEVSYIDYRLCPGIEKEDLGIYSLYETLKSKYGIKLVRETQEISITYANEDEIDLLGVESKAAMLMLKGLAFNDENLPVEYSKAITRGDRCCFASILE